MFKYSIFFSVMLTFGYCQTNWGSRSCMVDAVGYFTKIMQETMKELETEVKFCNLKMDDISAPINYELYNWHPVGTVNYTNGFLISIQYVDLSNFIGSFGTRTVNGSTQAVATLRGRLNFRLMKIGFDVDFHIEGYDPKHVSGAYTYTVISWEFFIERNLHSHETTISIVASSVQGANRMLFMPKSHFTEVLSRTYTPFLAANSFSRWGRDIVSPIVLRKAVETPFPEIRFNNDC